MRAHFGIVLLVALSAGSASAEVTDANMSCAEYVAAAGPTPKTGDATADKMVAEVEAKLISYCKANPKANATEAAMKAMGG